MHVPHDKLRRREIVKRHPPSWENEEKMRPRQNFGLEENGIFSQHRAMLLNHPVLIRALLKAACAAVCHRVPA